MGHAALLALALAATPPKVPDRLFTPASAIPAALADVRTLPPEARCFARYLSLYPFPDADLPALHGDAAKVLNSLSRNSLMAAPAVVKGSGARLLRLLVTDYAPRPGEARQWCRAWRRLADLGSGRDPYPDPHFHREVEVGHYEDAYGNRAEDDAPGSHWVTTRHRQAQARWLPAQDALALAAETDCESPVLRLDWFAYYALLEPRYHEFLGLDDTKASFERLAGVEEVREDDETRELGSVVLDSEVAGNNRALFRRSSPKRHGRGYFWESRDFDKSIKANDVLQDPSKVVARAFETIGALPNGLQFYGVFDAGGKRLDRAGIEFAHDSRNGFRSVEVEVRNCFCCHDEGIIPVADDVRGYSGRDVALALRRLGERDEKKAAFIRDRYFSEDVASLVAGDQASYAAAVRACNGLAPAASGLALRRLLLAFERNRVLEDLALETGYPVVTVRGVLERSAPTPFDPAPVGFGLDHSVVGVLAGKKRVRFDQFSSAGFGQLMERLAALPVEAPPPARRPPPKDTRTARRANP